MAGRTFYTNNRTYYGFDQDFSTPHKLVLVRRDSGVLQVWAIDGVDITEEMDEFLRFLSSHTDSGQVLGTYEENGFRGFVCADQFVAEESRWHMSKFDPEVGF